MVTRDTIKFFSLVALTLVCIGSFFTSPSISMMNPSMRVITAIDANTRKFCSAPRKEAKECENRINVDSSGGKEDCNKYGEVAKKCERVVRKAFRYINMGGCPKQLKLLTLCENEWCYQDPTLCQKECAVVKNSLSLCIQERIEHYFKRNGLKENGTI